MRGRQTEIVQAAAQRHRDAIENPPVPEPPMLERITTWVRDNPWLAAWLSTFVAAFLFAPWTWVLFVIAAGIILAIVRSGDVGHHEPKASAPDSDRDSAE